MSFDTRIPPALRSARFNHIIVDRDGEEVIGYAYSTIADKKFTPEVLQHFNAMLSLISIQSRDKK
jgi:hypothetical protein